MPIIVCPDCNNEISDSAETCPKCGRPNSGKINSNSEPNNHKEISAILGLGILLMPYIFSWFTLRKGYGRLGRMISFSWMAVVLIVVVASDGGNSPTTSSSNVVNKPTPKEKQYPSKSDTYHEVNSEVGCDSKYSDDKKRDIFNEEYRDHWFKWRGVVVLAESGEASLNLDGVGTQDLKVHFENPQAGYNLTKDSMITVKFLMKQAGGCFLPFSGDRAEIIEP